MTISQTKSYKNIFLTIFLAAAILLCGLLILHFAPLPKRDILATGFLADIVVTFPVAYYFLIIRPNQLKMRRMLLVISACLLVAYLILPPHQKYYVLQIRQISALLELGFLIYAISKIKSIISVYKQQETEYQDFGYDLSKSLVAVLGDSLPVKMLASELIILRFGLGFWKKFRPMSSNIKQFSVYKEAGYAGFFGVILSVFLIELVIVHLLIMRYNLLAANIVTLASAYGLIFLIGNFSALVKSPILFLPDKILLRVGFRWRSLVNINNISSAEKIGYSYEADESCFKGSLMKNSANVLINFKHPVTVDRIYRKPIMVDKMIVSIDQVDAFLLEIRNQNC
ncbi:MAG: hypothetical protein EOP42_09460 [Sphingobacteriaceae bacterium]|nr:MAG: hypothetical protein EOP42_09460 [Sphingobacteriaceae bacterium]